MGKETTKKLMKILGYLVKCLKTLSQCEPSPTLHEQEFKIHLKHNTETDYQYCKYNNLYSAIALVMAQYSRTWKLLAVTKIQF